MRTQLLNFFKNLFKGCNIYTETALKKREIDLGLNKIRGVFRALWNAYDGTFVGELFIAKSQESSIMFDSFPDTPLEIKTKFLHATESESITFYIQLTCLLIVSLSGLLFPFPEIHMYNLFENSINFDGISSPVQIKILQPDTFWSNF